jgi:hypothetical protein
MDQWTVLVNAVISIVNSSVAERLAASQQALSTMEPVSYI